MSIELCVYYENADAGGLLCHPRYLGNLERVRMEWGVPVKKLAADG